MMRYGIGESLGAVIGRANRAHLPLLHFIRDAITSECPVQNAGERGSGRILFTQVTRGDKSRSILKEGLRIISFARFALE
jgi:hypothetical protein